MNQQIDIEDELSALWQRIYTEIVRILKEHNQINTTIELSDCLIKSIIVDEEGILQFTSHDEITDCAENFTDTVIYDVYDKLTQSHTISK